jgi:putative transposase
MARPLRIEFPFAVYHITSRGNARADIFNDGSDRYTFLDALSNVVIRYNWLCHAYCLMDNHYHLLIETPDANLSHGMRQLNGTYTQTFNKRHGRVGHIFQGRFRGILVEKDSHLLELCRYVVLNPVRARMVADPAEWRWSSYRATAGLAESQAFLRLDWLLCQFHTSKQAAREKYRQFVHDGMAESNSPWEALKGRVVMGSAGWVEEVHRVVGNKEEMPEIPRLQRLVGRPSLDALFEDRSVNSKQERDSAIFEAHVKYGYDLKEIAQFLKIHYTTVSKIIKVGFNQK